MSAKRVIVVAAGSVGKPIHPGPGERWFRPHRAAAPGAITLAHLLRGPGGLRNAVIELSSAASDPQVRYEIAYELAALVEPFLLKQAKPSIIDEHIEHQLRDDREATTASIERKLAKLGCEIKRRTLERHIQRVCAKLGIKRRSGRPRSK